MRILMLLVILLGPAINLIYGQTVTYQVTSLADDGTPGTLRYFLDSSTPLLNNAVLQANDGEDVLIQFNVIPGVPGDPALCALTSALPLIFIIDGSITFDGSGAADPQGITFAGTQTDATFKNGLFFLQVGSLASITVKDLTFTGFLHNGGNIRRSAIKIDKSNNVDVHDCIFENDRGILIGSSNNVDVHLNTFNSNPISIATGVTVRSETASPINQIDIFDNDFNSTGTNGQAIDIQLRIANTGYIDFSDNTCTNGGSGVNIVNFLGPFTDPLTQLTIDNNIITNNNGGIILIDPLPYWTITKNTLDNIFVDFTISSTASTFPNLVGIDFIEDLNALGLSVNNTENVFLTSLQPTRSFMIHGRFGQSIRIIGWDLDGFISIGIGPSTIVRDNKIIASLNVDQPIGLVSGGNDDIAKPDILKAVTDGNDLLIDFMLPDNFSANEDFVVDFYECNSNGDLVSYLGELAIGSFSTSTVYPITFPGTSLVAGDRIGATVTSLGGTGTLIGTSEVDYEEVTGECCNGEFPVPNIGTSTFGEIGQFYIDETNGEFVYLRDDCPTVYSFDCFSGQRSPIILGNVVSASAVTFSDDWIQSRPEIYFPNPINSTIPPNVFETGEANKWRVKDQFVYRSAIDVNSETENLDKGTFPLTMFDWKNEGNNEPNSWVRISRMNNYTPNGMPEEDENILGIKSTAIYGYNNVMPILTAQNAANQTVSYESFENEYTDPVSSIKYFEDGLVSDNSVGSRVLGSGHTGAYAVQLNTSATQKLKIATALDDEAIDQGIIVRAWLKVNKNKRDLIDQNETNVNLIKVVIGPEGGAWDDANPFEMYKISDAGEWALYEVSISQSAISALLLPTEELMVSMFVDMPGAYTVGDVFLDDVRIQPVESEMVCYVYDQTHRLLAVLDDQHYAMIYQYNMEGVLIRKLKETVEGIKTVSESHYNTKGIDR